MIEPIQDIVICELVENEKKQGSIILAGTEKNKKDMATVIAVGPEVQGVEAGNTVLLNEHKYMTLKDDGNDYISLREAGILAVVEN